jgi:mono/diheme cytochrome c family protein
LKGEGAVLKIQGIIFTAILLIFMTHTAYAGDPFAGSSIYAQHCAHCHGANGRGEIAGVPSFTGGRLMAKSDFQLRAIVQSGKDVMPGYQGILTDMQIQDVIAYIRTFF